MIKFTASALKWINNAFDYSINFSIHSPEFIVLEEKTFFVRLV